MTAAGQSFTTGMGKLAPNARMKSLAGADDLRKMGILLTSKGRERMIEWDSSI